MTYEPRLPARLRGGLRRDLRRYRLGLPPSPLRYLPRLRRYEVRTRDAMTTLGYELSEEDLVSPAAIIHQANELTD